MIECVRAERFVVRPLREPDRGALARMHRASDARFAEELARTRTGSAAGTDVGLGLHRVQANIIPSNGASVRVAEARHEHRPRFLRGDGEETPGA